ncbi:MAG: hypothetical protein RLZ47_320 [Bacteroidota bacterium]|jgi:hypothetical protein
MKTLHVKDFNDFIKHLNHVVDQKDLLALYRGQVNNQPLLPSIARDNPQINTTIIEQEMLAELKRRSQLFSINQLNNDLDWCVYAQHFGLKTRLLDWTSNPLTALWFAFSPDVNNPDEHRFVYIFLSKKNEVIMKADTISPWKLTVTKILKPPQNSNRIISQSGWFTVHPYSAKVKKFVSLDKNSKLGNRVVQFKIPNDQRGDILKKLNLMGINYQSLFPDIGGVCEQLNWELLGGVQI